VGAQGTLRQGDGEGGVGGEVEGWVPFAPVSVPSSCLASVAPLGLSVGGEDDGVGTMVGLLTHLMTAMLTGAVVLALYTDSCAAMIMVEK
jgi:hypothetical protein